MPEGGTAAGAGAETYTQNTISEDGSRVFFTDAENGHVYVREINHNSTRPVSIGSAVWREPARPDHEGILHENGELYQFDLASELDRAHHPSVGMRCPGDAGVSRDSSFVYFVAEAL